MKYFNTKNLLIIIPNSGIVMYPFELQDTFLIFMNVLHVLLST